MCLGLVVGSSWTDFLGLRASSIHLGCLVDLGGWRRCAMTYSFPSHTESEELVEHRYLKVFHCPDVEASPTGSSHWPSALQFGWWKP